MEHRQIGHQFSDVDRAEKPAEFVRYLDERGGLDFFQVLEQRMAALLDVRPAGRYDELRSVPGEAVRSSGSATAMLYDLRDGTSICDMVARKQMRGTASQGVGTSISTRSTARACTPLC